MAHTLPQRPSFVPPPPEPTISSALEADLDLLASSSAGPSSSTTCVICSLPPKYTCPGCSRKTCSLPCSKTHKSKFQCDGKRDPTAFVTLKEVDEGVWSGDYKWLEESRRKIAQWGEALPPSALAQASAEKNKWNNKKRKRGPAGGALSVLEQELEKRGIQVEFMPDGMDRRKKNQSSYNIQHKSLRLTVQLQLMDSLKPTNASPMVNHPRLAFPPQSGEPATLPSLLPIDLRNRSDLVFVLPYHTPQQTEISSIPGQRFFPQLSSVVPLIDALRGTAFVEFPSIRVYTKTEWDDKSKRGEVVVLPLLLSGAPIPHSPKRIRENQPPLASTTNTVRAPMATFIAGPLLKEDNYLKTLATPSVSGPTPVLGLGLGNYDSDEDDEDAVDDAA